MSKYEPRGESGKRNQKKDRTLTSYHFGLLFNCEAHGKNITEKKNNNAFPDGFERCTDFSCKRNEERKVVIFAL